MKTRFALLAVAVLAFGFAGSGAQANTLPATVETDVVKLDGSPDHKVTGAKKAVKKIAKAKRIKKHMKFAKKPMGQPPVGAPPSGGKPGDIQPPAGKSEKTPS